MQPLLRSVLSSTILKHSADLFKAHPDEIACLIMEPSGHDLPKDGYLKEAKALVNANGALMIFDEVKTGFRYALGRRTRIFRGHT